MWMDRMRDTMNCKSGHPTVFQINNYITTIDTAKCVFNEATCFDLFKRSPSGYTNFVQIKCV
jgi:hypothetical protein